jgi:hypothetical protein
MRMGEPMKTFDGSASQRYRHLRPLPAYRYSELPDDETGDDLELESSSGCVGPVIIVLILVSGLLWLGIITGVMRVFL